MSSRSYHVETIDQMRRLAGMTAARHPSTGVVNLNEIGPLPDGFPRRMTYGFYSLGCKTGLTDQIRYGRMRYDFEAGGLGFTRPQ